MKQHLPDTHVLPRIENILLFKEIQHMTGIFQTNSAQGHSRMAPPEKLPFLPCEMPSITDLIC
jgi:hypothetical protein